CGADHGGGSPPGLAGDREAAVAARLLDTGGLQQRQGATTGADEDELRGHGAAAGRGRVPGAVAQPQAPAAVTQLLEAAHLVAEVELGVVVGREADELLGERAEVDVGTRGG